jgi:hypothetical protein
MPLPGDELIPSAIGSLTHAITIHAPPRDIWPWLVQMGAGRAGWYSYDRLDNGGHRSADHILQEYQNIAQGSFMPALPSAKDAFVVLGFRPDHVLILGAGPVLGAPLSTWVFVLKPEAEARTRLVVRARGHAGYRLFGMPPMISLTVVRLVHWIMQRKQLLGLKRRVEATASLAT